MKRLAALVSCFVFLFVSSVSYTCSAADEEPDYATVTSPDSVDDLLNFGFEPLGDNAYGLSSEYDFSFMGTSSDSNYTVKYPDFDINKIDLSSFPDEVYEIVKDTNSTILVYVQSVTAVDIFVARNCFLATTDGYGYTHLFFDNRGTSGSSFFLNHACFKARYKWGKTADEYTLISYWSEPTVKFLGSEGSTSWSYYATSSKPGFVGDFYAFNVNANSWRNPSDYSSVSISNNAGSLTATGYTGPLDEKYTKFNTYYYGNGYSIRMIPGADFPTHEKQQAVTQKGILAGIRDLISKVTDLPGNIASGISGFFSTLGDRISGFFSSFFESISTFLRSLFIPTEEFFDLYIENLQTFFSERFGFLYELPNAIVTILRSLISYKPSTEGYFIHFPAVSVPSIGADGKLVWHQIIAERDIFFDFLSEGPLSLLYNGYRSFIWLAYCLMLAQQMSRKYNEVFGGG